MKTLTNLSIFLKTLVAVNPVNEWNEEAWVTKYIVRCKQLVVTP